MQYFEYCLQEGISEATQGCLKKAIIQQSDKSVL